MMNKRRAAERATITARLEFLDAEERHSKPNVMDGHDHTACANMGKTFYGIEREPKYFDIACKRIEQAYAQSRLFA